MKMPDSILPLERCLGRARDLRRIEGLRPVQRSSVMVMAVEVVGLVGYEAAPRLFHVDWGDYAVALGGLVLARAQFGLPAHECKRFHCAWCRVTCGQSGRGYTIYRSGHNCGPLWTCHSRQRLRAETVRASSNGLTTRIQHPRLSMEVGQMGAETCQFACAALPLHHSSTRGVGGIASELRRRPCAVGSAFIGRSGHCPMYASLPRLTPLARVLCSLD